MGVRNFIIIVVAIAIAAACHNITVKQRYASLFADAVTKIDDRALQVKTERQLFDAAMHGMLRSLDANSAFIAGEEYLAMDQRLRQQFGGIGIYVSVNPATKELTVTSPMPDSPALSAGIRSGDVILEIDGFPTRELESTEAVQRMRGPLDTSLTLTLRRLPNETPFQVSLKRANIQTQSVLGDVRRRDGSWELFLPEDPRIAYVHITEFSERTRSEFVDLLNPIQPKIQGMILDLRGNGGGLLDQAVGICDDFLGRPRTIVEILGRGNRLVQPPYIADSKVVLNEAIPLVVLIDRFTASASEIVAACLQDNHRAVIIGEQSYGKGTVQEVIPFEPGKSSLKLTTQTYRRPSGKNIDRGDREIRSELYGVLPDPEFRITLTEDDVFQILAIRNRRQYKLLDIFSNRTPIKDDSEINQTDEPKSKLTEDPVLQRAIEYLQQNLDGKSAT